MKELSDPVVVGIVVGAHGIRGTFRVRSTGRHLREGVTLVISGEPRRITKVRETPKGFLVDLEGVKKRAEVEVMRGQELLMDRDELDDPEPGEFYVADLVGLTVLDERGNKLGVVSETTPSPAHEVLTIRDGDTESYVPFTLEHVPKVRMDERVVVVRPPEE